MVFDRSLRWIFDKLARSHGSFSEDYPAELFREIKSFADLRKGRSMLEVGCGTGIATLPFAKTRADITAMDISDNAIWQAKKKTDHFPNVRYKVGAFEESTLPANSFEVITAAQSWHWLDPARAYEKAHLLLKERGSLVLFWKFQDSDKSPLVRAINTLFSKHCDRYPIDFGSTASSENRLSKCGLFDQPTRFEYNKDKKIAKTDLRTLVSVYSWVNALTTRKQRCAFFDDLSSLLEEEKETISIPYRYVLLMSRRR